MSDVAVRPLTQSDAPDLVRLLVANRTFLAPFEPDRPESYFRVSGQLDRIAGLEADQAAGRGYYGGIVVDGRLAGTVSLSPIVRGAAQSAAIGYWVAEPLCGRGVATAAVREMARIAFGELGLHRLDSSTLVDNAASQRVLAKTGFQRVGLAPRYLHIAGEWRDCVLFQLLAD